MIRNIISSLFLLVVFPAKAWQQIAEKKESHDHFLNYFLYPMMGLTALSAFGGFLAPGFTLEQALKWVTIDFVQYFVGFFVSSWTTGVLQSKDMKMDIYFSSDVTIEYFKLTQGGWGGDYPKNLLVIY